MLSVMILALASSASFGLGPEWSPVADPLSEARAGKLYCDTPNRQAKTCEGAVTYKWADDGSIVGAVIIPINNEPDLAVVMAVPSWVEGGALCSRLEQADFDKIRLMLGAKLYERPKGQKLLAMFKEQMAMKLAGKLMCEHVFSNADRLLSIATIDGVHQPELDGEIAWLDPSNNFDLRATENILDE
jgi:hypothetical protein